MPPPPIKAAISDSHAGLLTPRETEPVFQSLGAAKFLPRRVYNDPEVFEAEKDRIFWKEWLPAGVLDKVRNSGDYFTVDILGQPLMVVRDAKKKVRTYYRVCAHRAMIIAEGEGNAERFECPYHRWTYDLSGKLVAAPQMQKVAKERKKDICLKEVRTEIWQGFVMINFDSDAEPFAPKMAELDKMLEPFDIANLVVPLERPYPADWNWKIMIENGDAYHVLGVHRNSFEPTAPAGNTIMEPFEGKPFAMYHMYYADGMGPRRTPSSPDEVLKPTIVNVPEKVYEHLTFVFVWPCLSFSLAPDGVTSYMTTVNAEGNCTFTWRWHVPQETVDHPNADEFIKQSRETFDLVHGEDESACAGVKIGYASEGWEPTAMSHLDESVWQFQRWYARRMSAASTDR